MPHIKASYAKYQNDPTVQLSTPFCRVAQSVGQGTSVVDIEVGIAGKVGMKGETKEALLAARVAHLVGNIEERRRGNLAVLNDEDATGLLEDKHAPAAIVRELDIGGLDETGCNRRPLIGSGIGERRGGRRSAC